MFDDARRRHFQALKSAFEFARASEFSWRDGAGASYANQVRVVQDCIAVGTPCGTSPAELIPFFLSTSWEGRVDAGGLWRAYAKAGFIETELKLQMHVKNGPLRAKSRDGFVTLLPLEMAIALGHLRGAAALVEAGARADAVPSQEWKPAGKKPMDIFGFIKFAARGEETVARLRAIAAQALGATPLERAVFDGDVDKFRGLLDTGASISTVPSRAWESGARKPLDVRGFIKFACKNAELRTQFEALATKASMTELIRAGMAPKPKAVSKRPAAHATLSVVEVAGDVTPSHDSAGADAAAQVDTEAAPVTASRRRRLGI